MQKKTQLRRFGSFSKQTCRQGFPETELKLAGQVNTAGQCGLDTCMTLLGLLAKLH